MDAGIAHTEKIRVPYGLQKSKNFTFGIAVRDFNLGNVRKGVLVEIRCVQLFFCLFLVIQCAYLLQVPNIY